MKVLIFAAYLLCFSFASFHSANAQTNVQRSFAKDTTPIEDLDFHLSKSEFMYYYGTEDTAKAIINMFYRKRGIAVLDFLVWPIATTAVGGAAIGIGAVLSLAETTAAATAFVAGGVVLYVVGSYVIPIYYLVQRVNFSRKKLLYALVSRERGMGISYQIIDNLRDKDFR